MEDYKRLRLHHFDPALISGEVTTDLVHIVAELTENALSFSPPGSPVDVYGRFLEDGYVLVVVDSGIGMSGADLDVANQRLEGLGSDGDVPGRYLGHFVAGRLASRHGLSISLQASHSGGLVARVRIPPNLIEEPVPDLSAVAEVRPSPVVTTPPVVGNAPPIRVAAAPADVPAPPADPFSTSVTGRSAAPEDDATSPDAGDIENDVDAVRSLLGAGNVSEDDEGLDALVTSDLLAPSPAGPPSGPDDLSALSGPGIDDSFEQGAPAGPPQSADLSDADLESLADDAEAWSAEVSPHDRQDRAGPSASANDLQALEARVRALDAARETDKKAIIDQLAKELASMSGSHGKTTTANPPKNADTTSDDHSVHVVQSGETLTSIAKSSGITIADLRKANNLTSDSLKVGQKLVIPTK